MTKLVRLALDKANNRVLVLDHDKGVKVAEGHEDLGLVAEGVHRQAIQERLFNQYGIENLDDIDVVFADEDGNVVDEPVVENPDVSTQVTDPEPVVDANPEPVVVTDPAPQDADNAYVESNEPVPVVETAQPEVVEQPVVEDEQSEDEKKDAE